MTNHSNITTNARSIGVSGLYDFPTMSNITPYVGARLAYNRLKFDASETYQTPPSGQTATDHVSENLKNGSVGISAIAGVQYAINLNLALDGAIKYNRLGKIVGREYNHSLNNIGTNLTGRIKDIKLNQYGTKVGLRYSF